ncbi:MAG: DeoR/GlpR family DNA-binding transcription regulator [Litorivicinus sp.]
MNPRDKKILDWARERGFISVDDIAQQFDVTLQTARRDLTRLADLGWLSRVRGGAVPIGESETSEYIRRKQSGRAAKRAIAQRVAARVPDHASLFINIGTTNEAVAEALIERTGLQVVTNNIHVAATLSGRSDARVIIAGGEVRSEDGGVVGDATRDFIDQFRLDFAILGISAVDREGVLLEHDYREARIAQSIMANAKHRILVAEGVKFQRTAMTRVADLSQLEEVVSDIERPKHLERFTKLAWIQSS